MSSRDSRSIPQRIAQFSENYGAQTFSLFGSIALAIAGILPSVQQGQGWIWLNNTVYGRVFMLGAFFSVIGGAVSIISAPGYKSQQERIRFLEGELASKTKALENELVIQKKVLENELSARKKGYSRILNDELKVLTRILNFGNNDRLSLYRYDRRERRFIMIARHSSNPRFKQPGRVFYPEDSGCIGKAWEQGSCFVDLPEPGTEQYYRVHEELWNMNRQTVDFITMKSRTIGGISLENLSGERIAVLIFESTRNKAFRENSIKNLMNNCGEAARITYLLERVGKIEPDLIYAHEEGF
ncbi:MAG TPA: hypothetical protein IGS53_11110 [Leptolyngbyaceae cyanobacterium M33_DOE_097]|nr:hypothetical protein [Leptolyngbyaceae cyanobacterium M33_DOE_097]